MQTPLSYNGRARMEPNVVGHGRWARSLLMALIKGIIRLTNCLIHLVNGDFRLSLPDFQIACQTQEQHGNLKTEKTHAEQGSSLVSSVLRQLHKLLIYGS